MGSTGVATLKRRSDERSLFISLAIHIGLAGFAYLLSQPWLWQSSPETVEFEVISQPQVVSGNLQAQRALTLQAPPKVAPKAPDSRAVFGSSRKAITSSEGLDVKAGNTVAKAQDNLKLNADDADALPVPVDEFLVSRMPKLLAEVRVPYPQEAKSRKIEGVVMLELLVGADGLVKSAKLISGPGAGLNEAALEAVKGFKFEAALAGDKKVPVVIRYAYRFIIE